MKDVYAVLRLKEIEQSRLQREVEALRVAAPLLSADGEARCQPADSAARGR
jgi:hypothetical protein